MTDNTQELDEILKEVREASWSMGLQNAPLDQLHNPRNNKRATDKAKQAILDWHNKQIVKALLKEALIFYDDAINSTPHDHIIYARRRVDRYLDTLKEHKERDDE